MYELIPLAYMLLIHLQHYTTDSTVLYCKLVLPRQWSTITSDSIQKCPIKHWMAGKFSLVLL